MNKFIKDNLITILIVLIGIAITLFFIFPNQNQDQKVLQEKIITPDKPIEEVIEIFSEQGEVLTESMVRKNIVGLWQSLDNKDYQVEFTKEGEMIENLNQNKVIGFWDLVSFIEGPNEVISAISFSEDGVYLRQSLDGGKNHFYYKVAQVDSDRLVTIYLHQGGILGFSRIR